LVGPQSTIDGGSIKELFFIVDFGHFVFVKQWILRSEVLRIAIIEDELHGPAIKRKNRHHICAIQLQE
jgi:hypothetical protein